MCGVRYGNGQRSLNVREAGLTLIVNLTRSASAVALAALRCEAIVSYLCETEAESAVAEKTLNQPQFVPLLFCHYIQVTELSINFVRKNKHPGMFKEPEGHLTTFTAVSKKPPESSKTLLTIWLKKYSIHCSIK